MSLTHARPWREFLMDIKIEHSIFALPFAVAAFCWVSLPRPTPLQGVALFLCIVSARSFAMGWNRVTDAAIDAANPRTKMRAIAAGRLKRNEGRLISLFLPVFLWRALFP